jgi:hypothetical protein
MEFGGVMTGQAVKLAFHWQVSGNLTLDVAGKPVFPLVPPGPGVYRITIDAEDASVYFGEATGLPERLRRYRNPGKRQPTSLRIHKLLCEALAGGGHCQVAVAKIHSFQMDRSDARLDLRLKAARVLIESAGIILARNEGRRSVLNLDPGFDHALGGD